MTHPAPDADGENGGAAAAPAMVHRLAQRARRAGDHLGAPLIAVITGIGILAAADRADWLRDAAATFVEMGFDPDRGLLLASLVLGSAVAALATLLSGHRVTAVLLGCVAVAISFGPTFLAETTAAMAETTTRVSFDPAGWLLTAVALGGAAFAASWSAATLLATIRAGAVTGVDAIAGRSGRRNRTAVARAVAGFLAVTCVLSVVPVLGDIFNYGPDVRMRHGAGAPIGLVDGSPGGNTQPGAPTAAGSTAPGLTIPGGGSDVGTRQPVARSPAPAGAAGSGAPDRRPWLAWTPTGPGSLTTTTFPAPWQGGTATTVTVTLYLPPSYASSGRRYPVILEVPWSLGYWDASLHLPAMLDGLIDTGQMPASIVAFVSLHGGPYPDSECVDSADGRELAESFVVGTVMPWLDQHLRTIPSPDARTLFGFSEGGFCSANLLLRHPDVFHGAIAMSGYFQAGLASRQTINAWRPFGSDPQRLADNSPLQTCARIPAAVRHDLFVALSGDPTEPLYGPQMRAFEATLSGNGIASAWLPTSLGHRWNAVGAELPAALAAVAARQAAAGVFG